VDGFKKKLGERTLPNFYHVIREAQRKAGLREDQIDYLAILHFKRSTHDLVLKDLGLSENQTTYLDEYGHIGQNDQIISLEEGLRAGKIKAGDNVVMVGAGLGFVWAAAVVRWG
jgi:3-oxoacyl-[acyl-carrier-protein] synthase-3